MCPAEAVWRAAGLLALDDFGDSVLAGERELAMSVLRCYVAGMPLSTVQISALRAASDWHNVRSIADCQAEF